MATLKKLGTPQGVGKWKQLETVGDVKRFLAWCIHSVRNQSLDTKTAATLGQLACYLLNTIRDGDFERRLKDLEEALAHDAERPSSPALPH